MYDVVYYTAENRKEAESLLRRLTDDEAKEINSTPLRAVVFKPCQMLPTVNPGNVTQRVMGKAQMRNLWGHSVINMDSPKEFFELQELKPGLVGGNFLPGVFDRPSIQKQIVIEKAQAKRVAERTEVYLDIEEKASDCSYQVGLTAAQWLRRICGLKIDNDKSQRLLEQIALHAQAGHPLACTLLKTCQDIALVAAEESKPKFDEAMLNDVELRAGMAVSAVQGASWKNGRMGLV
jgi:hypothetical protein